MLAWPVRIVITKKLICGGCLSFMRWQVIVAGAAARGIAVLSGR